MATHKLHGAILAAGRGTRMQPFSERFPKPLLPVGNKPMIVHQIDIMRSIGIETIAVLIGHKGYEIAKVLGDGKAHGVKIRYVEQTSMLGIAHAVGRMEPELQDHPFLLFLGDIYFVPERLEDMYAIYEKQGGGAVLATKEERDPEAIRRNFAILRNASGLVTRVIEKPRHTPNSLKGVGAYLFEPTIFDAIRRTPRTALRDEYELTDAIQVLIDDGHPVRTANVILEDINLTTPSDLLRCNLLHLQSHGDPIATGVSVHPEAQIENSILGANVRVDHPIHIANSLVFEDSRVESKADLDRAIVTPQGLVDCRPHLDLSQIQNAARDLLAAQ